MRPDELLYLELRAEEELEQAQNSTNRCAVRAHYELARLYLDKLFPENRPLASENAAYDPVIAR